jgi:hypothetical protein
MIIDLIGLLGCSLAVTAYMLLLIKKFSSNQKRFLGMNLLASTLLTVNGILSNAPLFYPTLNVMWMVGSAIQIIRKPKKLSLDEAGWAMVQE